MMSVTVYGFKLCSFLPLLEKASIASENLLGDGSFVIFD